MKTKAWAIATILLCTIATSLAAVFNKKGAINFELTIKGTILNGYLILGLSLLAVGMLLLMISLKGGDVTVIYPIISTSYIWVTIMSYFIFKEAINHFKILGIASIIGGVVIINVSNATGGKSK